jgi:hypothetical protein
VRLLPPWGCHGGKDDIAGLETMVSVSAIFLAHESIET